MKQPKGQPQDQGSRNQAARSDRQVMQQIVLKGSVAGSLR